MKTIVAAIATLGADTAAIEKALSIVLDYEKLLADEKGEVAARLVAGTKG